MCSVALPAIDHTTPSPRIAALEELEREICELGAHIAAATCRWLLLVGEFDERSGWAEWGYKTCAHWLAWRCSLAPGAARERVRVARALRGLPLVQEAFSRGELSYCKVRAITRVAVPEIEAQLVELGRHATGAQLEKLLRGYRRAMSATVATAERAHERRYLSFIWEDDGSLRIDGRLTPDQAGLLLAALDAHERPREPGGDETLGMRRADALVDLARCGLERPAESRSSGDPCELVVHVDAETLATDEVHERAEIEAGAALPAETVRRLACDASVVWIVERDGKPLSVGRRRRRVHPALRRALRSRDRGCRFPGCDHRRFLHAHHIHHWARGGPTSLENLVHLCSYHHRLVHEGGFRVERTGGGGLRFRRPDGQVIADAPAGAVACGPSLEARNRARDVCPDAFTIRPVSEGDRLDYDIATDGLIARTLAGT